MFFEIKMSKYSFHEISRQDKNKIPQLTQKLRLDQLYLPRKKTLFFPNCSLTK